jgi:sulfite exporter TauE/SafE
MLQKIKSEFREIKAGSSGSRFIDHYKRTRKRESARGSVWRTLSYVFAGLILLLCGLLLSLPPGVPGFLLWIPGLALLSARFKSFAILLDRLELQTWKVWQRVRTQRRP